MEEEEEGARRGGRRRKERGGGGEGGSKGGREGEVCLGCCIWNSRCHIYLLVCQLANFLKRKWAPVHLSSLPPYGKPYKNGHKQNGQCGDVLT